MHDHSGQSQRVVEIICGAPCSGKSTLADQLAFDHDGVVIDRDRICADLAGEAMWLYPPHISDHAELIFRDVIQKIAHARSGRYYIVRSLPERLQRVKMGKWLRANVTILDPGMDVCLQRARDDNRPQGTETLIRQWYDRYLSSSEHP